MDYIGLVYFVENDMNAMSTMESSLRREEHRGAADQGAAPARRMR